MSIPEDDERYDHAAPSSKLAKHSINGLKNKARRGEIRARIKPNGWWEFHQGDCYRLGMRGRVVSTTTAV